MLSVREFADSLNIGMTRAWAEIKSGNVQVVRLGRLVRVPQSEVDRIISAAAPHRVLASLSHRRTA